MNASSLVRSKGTSKTSLIVMASRGRRSPRFFATTITRKRMSRAAASVTPSMEMPEYPDTTVAVAVMQRAMPPSAITFVMDEGFILRLLSQLKMLMLVSGHTWSASASLSFRQ